jgi:hypothetical protein
MPKKPLTAYMFFVREVSNLLNFNVPLKTRNWVARKMPDIAPLDIMKEVGKIW